MRKILFLAVALIAMIAASSCTSKADKLRQQQIADSIRQDSIKQEMRADSIKKAEEEAELKDEKIEFLKNFYKNVIYSNEQGDSYLAFAKNFERHLSPKVKKALEDYDDGIVYDDDARDMEKNVNLYVLGDEGDYGDEGPKIDIKAEADNWFKVTISGTNTTLKIKIDSDPDDDENFIITGLDIPTYSIKVKP